MKSSLSRMLMTRILLWGAVLLFVVTEVVVAVSVLRLPGGNLFPGLGSKYVILFITALPMIAGMNGYFSVRRRLSSGDEDVVSVLSVQFLLTIVMAYVVVVVCLSPYIRAFQALPK